MAAKTGEERLLSKIVDELDRIQDRVHKHMRGGSDSTEADRMHNATLLWFTELLDAAAERIVRPYREEVLGVPNENPDLG